MQNDLKCPKCSNKTVRSLPAIYYSRSRIELRNLLSPPSLFPKSLFLLVFAVPPIAVFFLYWNINKEIPFDFNIENVFSTATTNVMKIFFILFCLAVTLGFYCVIRLLVFFITLPITLPRYKKEKEKWDESYYCGRCHFVFNPESFENSKDSLRATSFETVKVENFSGRAGTLEKLRTIDPIEFEKFVGDLFEKMGYIVKTTPKTGDEGVDLFIHKNNHLAVVQCKRYRGNVGQPQLRDLFGAMLHNKASEAFLVTTGVISLPAQSWATGKPIHLVDGKMLLDWIEELNLSPKEVD
jgi:rubredoxin